MIALHALVLPILSFVVLAIIIVIADTAAASRALPRRGDNSTPLPSQFEFDTPWYHVRVTNKTNATIAREYARPDPRLVNYFLSDAGKQARSALMSSQRIPLWERSPASDYDDRIIWSPLMDNFSMPFFEQRMRGSGSGSSNGDKGLFRSGAGGVTFHVSSNGFLTPSVDANLCGSNQQHFFCNDYYFPNERNRRTVRLENDLVPEIALMVYDLDPTFSPSPHPISIFLSGNCGAAPSTPRSAAQHYFTNNVYDCDSVVFDVEHVPMFLNADQRTNTTPVRSRLSAQAQLYRNGTVVMRYLSMPPIHEEPWWFVPFQIDKVHPSCGLLHQNKAQIANVSEYCGDATPNNGGAPLYSEFVFTPRNYELEAAQSKKRAPPCEQRMTCNECVNFKNSASKNPSRMDDDVSCVWCEGAPPSAQTAAEAAGDSGRCIPLEMEEGICGATPELTVRNIGGSGSSTTTTSVVDNATQIASQCDALPQNYARLQLPYRNAWFSADVGLNLPEWRNGGAWADVSGPTVIRPTAESAATAGDGQSIGPRTVIPRWDKTTFLRLGATYGMQVTDANHSWQTTVEERSVRAPSLTAEQLVPSAWWLHNIDLAQGNADEVLQCTFGVNALAPESIITCDQNSSDLSRRNTVLRLNVFNLRKSLWADNVSLVSVPGVEFPSTSPQQPPHDYCIRRKCGDAPTLMKRQLCRSAESLRCDAFTMMTWRGTIVPAFNGTITFTLSVAIGEFGHIVANVDLSSPLGLTVPNVLPKQSQHFFLDFPGGAYSARMRRWAGTGLSAVMAPVTTCPTCPLGSSCDAMRGTCNCMPQFDDAKMCTRCKPDYMERGVLEWREIGQMTVIARRCVPCPRCYNGGRCNNVTGTCDCPLGFDGDLCDVVCAPEDVALLRSAACGNQTCISTGHALDHAITKCLNSGKTAWLCGRCRYLPLEVPSVVTLAPDPGDTGVFWAEFMGWSLLLILLCVGFYVLGKHCVRKMDEREAQRQLQQRRRGETEGSRGLRGNGRRHRHRSQQRPDRSSPSRSRRRGGSDSGSDDSVGSRDSRTWSRSDGSYDSDDGYRSGSNSGGDNDDDEQEMQSRHHHHAKLDDILRSLPPHVREMHILPMLEKSRGTAMEAKWQRRLDEARYAGERQSNPLGIVIPIPGSGAASALTVAATATTTVPSRLHVTNSSADLAASGAGRARDTRNVIPTATVLIAGNKRGGEGGEKGAPSRGENDDDDDGKEFLPPVHRQQQQSNSPGSYRLDDDDDNDDHARTTGGSFENNSNVRPPAHRGTVVKSNPLAPPASSDKEETVVAGKLIGLDDL